MKRFKRVYIEITNICNYNCDFCPSNRRELVQMSVDNFEIILRKMSPYTDFIYLHVKGEPLLHEHLQEILDLAYRYNMKVNIVTNGSLLKEKEDILVNAKSLRQLNISVHSVRHNKTKNIVQEDYLNSIVEVANNINKEIGSYISYRLWDLKDTRNVDEYEKVFNFFEKKYGIENIKNIITKKRYVELEENIFLNIDTIFIWPSMNNDIFSIEGSCYGLIDQIAILVDGSIVPCCLDQEGDILLGNIFKDDIGEVLQSKQVLDIIQGFRKNKLINPLCQRCGFRENKRS